MRSLFKHLFAIILAVFIIVPQTVSAMPDIMPLDKIENGMSGVAYTVIDNSGVIEPFNVDIIGLMDNGKGSNKMIMAKASGSVIEKTGGVLQGMSGSPVYINGKLVGAVASGLKEMSPYTFFITPIENMLKLWDLPDEKEQIIKNVVEVNEKTSDDKTSDEKTSDEKTSDDKTSDEKNSDEKNSDEKTSDDKKVEVEEKAALFFSGFDSSGLNFLKDKMSPLGFKNFFAMSSANSVGNVKYNATLEPGAPMGVAVVCGDFVVGATGTVTAVDNNKILGFGHPFSHGGNVNFFMMDSAVIGTVSGEVGNGVKIAKVGNIIGRINQDREAGIAGILGKFPSTVPISVTVTDPSAGKSETYNASIAYNEVLIPKLGASVAYTALSKTADSLAESTVSVDFGIRTNVVEGGTFSRQNMFYNATDVGQVAIIELMQALNLICSNTTKESNIYGIDINMTMETERKTATLISAVPDKTKVKPGETVNLTVTLQPYRKPNETLIVPYTVPVTRHAGPMALDLHGGALTQVNAAVANAGIIKPSNTTPAQNYEEKIKNFLKVGRNNQLVIEPGSLPDVKTEKELKKEIARAKKAQELFAKSGKKIPAPKESKFDTGYIIDNVIQVVINVDKA